MIHTGDCRDVMAGMEPESIDAIVTDPPYGLRFMGKAWDHGVPGQPFWDAALRVAKPGAYLLAFGGTRTVHRLTCAIEDAGWEIRDCLVWAYASGFPKSLNLHGEREGWGTALKPAWEPIVMARKPLRGTVAANVERYGTGALNIDGCRIGLPEGDAEFIASRVGTYADRPGPAAINVGERTPYEPVGRWPANIVLTDAIFDGDVPGVVGGGEAAGSKPFDWTDAAGREASVFYADTGTYSRFFLIPKAARSDREPVLGGLETTALHLDGAFAVICAKCNRQRVNVPGAACQCPEPEWVRKSQKGRANVHPTVKPTELMRHLVRLVTPTGGTVLDPFLGSGTTGLAAEMEGFPWVGIEIDAESVAIAEARLNGTQRGLGLGA